MKTRRPDTDRFQDLADRWERETAILSNSSRAAQHPAHREIISMGQPAVPLILARMEASGGHWFQALHEITGASPVDPQGPRQHSRDAGILAGLGQAEWCSMTATTWLRSEFPNLYREGLKGTADKLGNLGAEIFALVILGTILLVRPYRLFQEVILNEIVKLYERVERRYRPESHRQRADIAEDKIEDLEERNKATEERAKAAEERSQGRRGKSRRTRASEQGKTAPEGAAGGGTTRPGDIRRTGRAKPLLGLVTLEDALLAVDLVGQRLTPVDADQL